MLNSADGVTLPSAIAPPINTMRATRFLRRGAWRNAIAMLESGPVGTSVTSRSETVTRSTIRSTAWRGSSATAGTGSGGPSRPVVPWTLAAVTSGRTSGPSSPDATGTSVMPATVSTLRAFSWVLARGALPATQVMASRSMAGLAAAMRMATASSWPGSTSRMMGVGMSGSCRRLYVGSLRGGNGLWLGASATEPAAAPHGSAPWGEGQADDRDDVGDGVRQLAGADVGRLHVRRHALGGREEDARHEGAQRCAVAERLGRQGDPALARRHVAIEAA